MIALAGGNECLSISKRKGWGDMLFQLVKMFYQIRVVLGTFDIFPVVLVLRIFIPCFLNVDFVLIVIRHLRLNNNHENGNHTIAYQRF